MNLQDMTLGLPPTEMLYLRDSYLTKFSAKILRVEREGKNRAYIILDATAFHPKSGGQPTDTGTLGGQGYSLKVTKSMGFREVVIHYGMIEGEADGGTANGEVSWEPRYLYMRRHTGGHLLDHCLASLLDTPIETTDSWLGEDCYVAYSGVAPPLGVVSEAVEKENEIIRRGGRVMVEELSRLELLDRIPNAPNIHRLPSLERYRIVTIEGCEPIPCGGTHLKNVREIGSVRLVRIEQLGNEYRVYYDVTPEPFPFLK